MGGFVLLRVRAHRLLITAALLTVLLTTTVLAALAGFTSSVGDAGVRRTLATTDAAGTPLLLTRAAGQADRTRNDAAVRQLAADAFPGLPTGTLALALSDPYALPGAAEGADPDTATLGSPDRARLRLLSGAWPGTATPGAPIPVAVPQAAARRFGATGGRTPVVTVKDRISGKQVRLRITGVYTPRSGTDRYWQLDPLLGKGASRGSGNSSTAYGPLLVDDADFGNGAVPQYQESWQVVADFGGLGSAHLPVLAQSLRAVVNGIGDRSAGSGAGPFSATCVLPSLLDQLQNSLLVARATLLVAVLQLCLLAMMTLLLAARLLAEERESENALLRARGAAPRRLTLLAAAEAVLLVLPAAAFAPLLASPLIRLLGSYGPLARSGVRLDGPLPNSAWWAALAAAFASALVVLGPTLVRARSWSEHRRGRARRAALPGLLRGGSDLALLCLAVGAYWQLNHYAAQGDGSGVLTADSGGKLGIDPVLVAAPTLALCAGTVLTLRLIPMAAKAAERLTARGRSLPAAMVGWQLARRPQQGAGPVLVLALATAIGTLSIGQTATWQQSQTDQAAFNTGGQIRVAANSTPPFGQGGQYTAVPGVTGAVPVGRGSVSATSGRSAELVALDTRQEADRYPLRADLADRSARQLLSSLADKALPAAAQGIQVPGRPDSIVLDLSAGLALRGSGAAGATGLPQMSGSTDGVAIQVTDRYGLPYTLAAGSVEADGATHPVVFDLAAATGGGAPAYPLWVSGVTVTTPVSLGQAVTQTFTVHAVRGQGQGGAAAALPQGADWKASFDAGENNISYGPADGAAGYVDGKVLSMASGRGALLTAVIDSGTFRAGPGSDTPSGTLTLRPAGTPTGALPAVADHQFLSSTGTRIGSQLALPSGSGSVQVVITASVEALPGTGSAAEQGINGSALVQGSGYGSTDPSEYGGALLVDLASYNRRALADQATPLPAAEWWLSVASAPGTADRVGTALRSLQGVAAVYVRDQVSAAALSDPLGTGPQAALLAAVALAVALAAVGFSADAAGAVRRRTGEVAVLRALGAGRWQLVRGTAAELALPVVVGVGVGAGLGLALTRLVTPLLVITPVAHRPVPQVLVRIPGERLVLLLVAVAAVPLLTAVVAGLRGGDPARQLRQPEDS
ncbi:FtsX-like permease family protein [Streptacidiphilus carbonis]|uniref:FtsX-like permease family protein n=1 Tax=Streptacidiphilus carbonis TaxID=105422 RepID=UPI0005A8320D|nr:FtsX-like permease family protein [Streptacidiphilus carbonis]